ncbi:hypothetical protein GJAV_G00177420 [Gymnothorax javanicus]|nr:hypothetical protein GJAV_G00177420 [Gymnothorax javanicus]
MKIFVKAEPYHWVYAKINTTREYVGYRVSGWFVSLSILGSCQNPAGLHKRSCGHRLRQHILWSECSTLQLSEQK